LRIRQDALQSSANARRASSRRSPTLLCPPRRGAALSVRCSSKWPKRQLLTVTKEGTLPRSLKILGAEAGLPSLPAADIRLHVSPSADAPVSLLAQHLQEHLGKRRR